MADVKWIKMATGLPDNKKIKQIRRLPEGDTIALMWVFMMCLAGDVNENGLIYITPEVPYTDEMLADEFDIDINTVRLGLKTFERFGMIEIIEDVICLSAWEKWQSVDKLSELREYNRLAKQKSRAKAKQKLLEVNDTSMTSQPCQDTDIDIEIEEEKELDKEEEKTKKKTKPSAYYPMDEELNKAFLDYIEFRKKIKKPMTDRAIELAMNELDKLAGSDNEMAIQILNQSILRGWQGLFPLKDQTSGQTSRANSNQSYLDQWRDA